MIEGFATPEATARLARRSARTWNGLTLSSVGMGTYLGGTDKASQQGYEDAATVALGALNVLDTAPNYREQLSERDLGRAIARFCSTGGDRSQFLVCSKGGFLHGDAEDPAWFETEYKKTGVVTPYDVVKGVHCIKPEFIKKQIDRSRRNLGLGTLDVYLIHNPETQLAAGIPAKDVYARLREAFRQCERAVDAGKIRWYGVATWNGLRVPPGHPEHLSLARLLHEAGEARMAVRGKASEHHFRAIQLPLNAAMTEATEPTQPWPEDLLSTLDCAQRAKLLVLTSASIGQGRLAGKVPADFKQAMGTEHDLEACLQFTRSVPGVTTALVGMGRPEHAKQVVEWATRRAPDAQAVQTVAR